MKCLKKPTALLLTLLLICSVPGVGAAAEAEAEAEEDTLEDAYLYCQEDGMPKYWLDLTGAMADDPVYHVVVVLHGYFCIPQRIIRCKVRHILEAKAVNVMVGYSAVLVQRNDVAG